MGERHCSKIAAMQLFHELKQQFSALPDHVVSQCIVQNSYDRESCARSLRAVQESRPPPGAFPPPPPQPDLLPDSDEDSSGAAAGVSRLAMQEPSSPGPSPRAPRPATLDVGAGGRRLGDALQARPATSDEREDDAPEEIGATCAELTPGFKLNVNVARHSPASGSGDYASVPSQSGITPTEATGPRSVTSVSLTLRPPSSEPQPPIDVSSQGQNFTYSSSSVDPRGYQSRLQISIGHGSGAGARVKPPVRQRPTSLTTDVHNPSAAGSSSGLPMSPMPRSPRTVSAPTTPSGSAQSGPSPPSSLPATPQASPSTSLGAIPRTPKPTPKPRTKHVPRPEAEAESESEPGTSSEPRSTLESDDPQHQPQYPEEYREIMDQIPDEYKSLIFEHLYKKDLMAKAVDESEKELESLKKEIEMLSDPETSTALKDYERELRSQIYHLQLECERLTEEVDSQVDSQIPLGETDEEFYKSIYTGQNFDVPETEAQAAPPPLPAEPPVWEQPGPSTAEDPDDADGPPWVCPKCTFANHPLLNKCEECDTARVFERTQGETQDIHIRVTHHHNFSPQRTVHNWVI